ncbi:MAG: universal stress protein [Cyanobacteria bacterium REEB67]|nr:universal stress protein [Cyanobacteria bacterium REEB67]
MKRPRAKNRRKAPPKISATQTYVEPEHTNLPTVSPEKIARLPVEQGETNTAAIKSDENYSKDLKKVKYKEAEPGTFKVLIPINDQGSALYSLETVMARRWPAGTHFMLLTVVESIGEGSRDDTKAHKEILIAEQEEYRHFMQTWINRLKDSFTLVFPDTESSIESGRISEKILETAFDWEADYIIIGSHALSPSTRMALGSVASMVVEKCFCPVEAVRFRKLKAPVVSTEEFSAEKIRQLGSQGPKRVIVATYVSETEKKSAVIDWVANTNWLPGTEIKLVTVTAATKREAGVNFLASTKIYLSEHKYQSMLENHMRSLGKQIADKHPRCNVTILVIQSDSVPEAIFEFAATWDADLAILGPPRIIHRKPDEEASKPSSSDTVTIMNGLDCSVIALGRSDKENIHFSWYESLQVREEKAK